MEDRAFVFTDNFHEKVLNEDLPPQIDIPYVCSLTPSIRLIVKMGQHYGEKIRKLIEDTVLQIDGNHEVKISLKDNPDNRGNYRVMRQVDIMGPKGQVVFKIFAWWNKVQDRWHMLMELPHETVWETGGTNT